MKTCGVRRRGGSFCSWQDTSSHQTEMIGTMGLQCKNKGVKNGQKLSKAVEQWSLFPLQIMKRMLLKNCRIQMQLSKIFMCQSLSIAQWQDNCVKTGLFDFKQFCIDLLRKTRAEKYSSKKISDFFDQGHKKGSNNTDIAASEQSTTLLKKSLLIYSKILAARFASTSRPTVIFNNSLLLLKTLS